MRALIITIGDELLLGRTVDTNAAWMAGRLDELGFHVIQKFTIGDDFGQIVDVVRTSMANADVVLVTGGLGPTHDDITKKAIAEALHVPLQVDPDVESHLARLFEGRGRTFTEARRSMATVPEGFVPMTNAVGSAPGLLLQSEDSSLACLMIFPGVPYEMQSIFDDYAADVLARMAGGAGAAHRTYRTAGISENDLHMLLKDVIADLPEHAGIAFLPSPKSGVSVRLTVRGTSRVVANADADRIDQAIGRMIGEHVFGKDNDLLEEVVGRLLLDLDLSVSVAESCTGGLIADRLTDVSGSSNYVMGGVIAYSNAAKVDLLDVDRAVIEREGAVSKRVVQQMAEGCRQRFGTDVAISSTGIAGPTGGTSEKPVGTVWIGLSHERGSIAVQFRLVENRRLNKILASTLALNLLRKHLLKQF